MTSNSGLSCSCFGTNPLGDERTIRISPPHRGHQTLDQLEQRQHQADAAAWPRLDAGIEREASAVIPFAHGLGVFPFEQTATGQRPQQTGAAPGL